MKFCKKFIYAGIDSADYDIVVLSFEANPEYNLGLTREIQKGETTRFRFSANYLGTKYSDILSFNISIIKKSSINKQNSAFTEIEQRNILGWLTSPQLPQELKVYDDSNDGVTYYYGLFTDAIPKVVNGLLNGIDLTFTCSSQYGFTKPYEYKITSESENTIKQLTIDNISDEYEKPLYPIIVITPKSTGSVTINNNTIGRGMTIKCKKDDTVTLDCQNMIIKDLAGVLKYSDIGWNLSDLDSIWFPELIHGENTISVSGNAEFTFICQYPKKVGDTR